MFDLIKHIIENNYNTLLHYPNVVGIGASFKVIKNIVTSIPSLSIQVSHKCPKDYLTKENLIPSSYYGAITDVIEVKPDQFNSLQFKIRPVVGGFMISCFNKYKQGDSFTSTAGCMVWKEDSITKKRVNYILTVAHLFDDDSGNIYPDLVVYQPKPDFSFSDKNAIGVLSEWIAPLINNIATSRSVISFSDAALIKLKNPTIATPLIHGIGPIMGIKDISKISNAINLNVKATGATSGHVTGKIIATNVLKKIEKSNTLFTLYKDMIQTTKMSTFGDSGCILLDSSDNILGMCISSNDVSSSWCPINPILQHFNVSPIY